MFESLKRGSHVFIVCPSNEFQICDFKPFLQNGIDHNELVMILLQSCPNFYETDNLSKASPSLDLSHEKKCQVLFKSTEDWFNPFCCLDFNVFLNRWEKIIDEALKDGKEGIRLLVETNRFLREKLDNALISFDRIIQDLFNFPITSMYIYKSKDIEVMTPQQLAILKTCPEYPVNELNT